MTAFNKPHPSLWKPEKNDNAELKRKLEACEKENRSLTDLVHEIGETVTRHIRPIK